MDVSLKGIGATAAGTATDAPPFPTATPTKANTNSINATDVACTVGTTAASTTAPFRKTNVTVTASSIGRTEPSSKESSSTDNDKDMANTPLPTEDNTKVDGRMAGTMDLGHVRGKMGGGIGENGGMVWRMDKESRRIRMGM
mmetsp:Transcript_30407/g.46804  ORF Transcript_30407/g.46804 Transcript_30407/m.46804 type:complete len:142 (+) Transcript_30407:721-1146(+)